MTNLSSLLSSSAVLSSGEWESTMEETLPSPKTPTDSAAGSPEEPRARTSSRSRSFSISASTSPRFSAVPFSWEQRPGIPKALSQAAAAEDAAAHRLLPLPPPVRSHSDLPIPRKKRSAARLAAADPFAAALALCAKDFPDAGGDLEELWGVPDASPRRVTTIADRFRLFDLYGSCKATCSVIDATVRLPRTGPLGLLSRRPGAGDI
ncbi:uncharacterized protein LOC103988084 [Musa acuminata AAA Group]|uniref:uncharacterized protein LOC103988084 n=1 Tax=Musa acuminata AAA Group TaxID=214697 RepID=UPI0031DF793B